MLSGKLIVVSVLSAVMASQAGAERLSLTFLPPDLPPSNICNADPERFDEDETQITEAEEPGPQVLEDKVRLQFLSRDIRNLQRDNADDAFEFIMALISRRAELDGGYSGIDETFDRIDTYLAAGRVNALVDNRLIPSLAERVDEMNWSQAVRLSRFYLNGIGVEKDRDLAMRLIIDHAYLGNANALLEVLRMQLRGDDIDDWGLNLEETARLAFGGLVGQMNSGLCNRAERMAREYIDGDLLTPNPELAYAWRKFAADMGGAEAAWRIVEYHLSADGEKANNALLNHYLQKAISNGFVVLPETVDELVESGARTEEEIRRILGENRTRTGRSDRLSAVPYFELDVRITTTSIAEDGEYLQYLREVAELPGVPGPFLTKLAEEILLRKGRWAGMAEAEQLVRQAYRLGDPNAAVILAEFLLSQRSDQSKIEEAEAALMFAVEQHGHAVAMKALDGLYRCQSPDAPRMDEASFWASAYRAANVEPVSVSASNLARFDPRQEPEAVARIQSQSLRGHSGSTADWLQYLQSDVTTPGRTLRFWAERVARSDVALERYMGSEFELSLTREERQSAIEFFRRVYLDIGSSISLDLALTLIESTGRDRVVAGEIRQLLTNSGRRGQGATIRLLARLTGRDGAEVYQDFAAEIEKRGDFVALVFAAPYVSEETFHRYMDRAISMMNCNTKDVTELAEAYAKRGLDKDVMHWVKVGLSLEGGNSLTRLGLGDRQIDDFDRGLSIAQDTLDLPRPGVEDFDRRRQLYLNAADPSATGFNPKTAGTHLAAIFGTADRSGYVWALRQYRKAEPEVRRAVDALVDVRQALHRAAEGGDVVAQYELGMLMRTVANAREDLEMSTKWLSKAADAGHAEAMVDYAFAIAFGVGHEPDPKLALIWLDRAEGMNAKRGRELRDMLSAMVSE